MREHREATADLERRLRSPGTAVLARLRAAQAAHGGLTPDAVDEIAVELGVPRAHVHGTVTFYADLGFGPRPERP